MVLLMLEYVSFAGVPISTQWGAQGYFYPIQIAQYGLSHFSIFLNEAAPTQTQFVDGSEDVTSAWTFGKDATVKQVLDQGVQSRVTELQTTGEKDVFEYRTAPPQDERSAASERVDEMQIRG